MELSYSMPYQTIVVKKTIPYYSITLNRIMSRNSMNEVMLQELHQALDEIERDDNVNLIILQGQDGYFCTGMDFYGLDQSHLKGTRLYMDLLQRMSLIPRGMISLIDGVVMGGGVGLIAASDLVIATPQSQFSLPEAIWGLLPACVAPFLIRRVGFQAAYRLTVTTQAIDAVEAHRIQLVDVLASDLEQGVRPILLRLSRIDIRTLGEIKEYYDSLWNISSEIKSLAINKINQLIATPWIKKNILNAIEKRGEKNMTKDEKAWSALKTSIQQVLPEVEEKMLQPTHYLSDIGANSMDRADIIISTLENLQLKMPLAHFANAKTLGDLAHLFSAQLPE